MAAICYYSEHKHGVSPRQPRDPASAAFWKEGGGGGVRGGVRGGVGGDGQAFTPVAGEPGGSWRSGRRPAGGRGQGRASGQRNGEPHVPRASALLAACTGPLAGGPRLLSAPGFRRRHPFRLGGQPAGTSGPVARVTRESVPAYAPQPWA